MSGRVLPLAGSAGVVVLVVGVAIWLTPSTPRQDEQPRAGLAATLPPDAAGEFSAANLTIDELRHSSGSVLDGTSLARPAAGQSSGNSYVELLRREARRLDDIAAEYEERDSYDQADHARAEAESLRQMARRQAQPLIRFGGTTINR